MKTIVGTGVLTLPSGVARLAASSTGAEVEALALSAAGLLSFGAVSAWGFFLVGQVCSAVGARSYGEAWARSVGEGTAWVPASASLLLCFTGAVKAASVIGDFACDLLAFLLEVPYESLPHDAILAAIALAVLAPLCSLRSLAPLAVASLIGLIGAVSLHVCIGRSVGR